MSEAIIIALIAAGIPASVSLILYGGKTVDWLVQRWEKRREAKEVRAQRAKDQEEARKTTRVLLETIALKDQELAMKDRVIDDLLAVNTALRDGSRR